MSSKYSAHSIRSNNTNSEFSKSLLHTNVSPNRKRPKKKKKKKNLCILDEAYSIIEETAARESFSAIIKQGDDFIQQSLSNGSSISTSNQFLNDSSPQHLYNKKNKKIKDSNTTSSSSSRTSHDKTVFEYEEALRRRDFQKVLWMIENGEMPIDYEAMNGENALLASIDGKNPIALEILLKKNIQKLI
jgi:hypothetical protein